MERTDVKYFFTRAMPLKVLQLFKQK